MTIVSWRYTMSTGVLIAIAAVLGILYLLKRNARIKKESRSRL